MNRQGVPLQNFKTAALEWAAGARGQVLVDAAAAALAEGVDSPTLRVLAGAPHMSADDEASELASSVFEELGLSIPERLSAGARVAAASLRAAECLLVRSRRVSWRRRCGRRTSRRTTRVNSTGSRRSMMRTT